MCLNIAVYDVIAALPGGVCSIHDVVKALSDIDRESVKSAVHRLSDKGVLVARHHCFGFMYSMAPGATRPIDGRGRPRTCLGVTTAI
jgi:predicted transcriptional regulator